MATSSATSATSGTSATDPVPGAATAPGGGSAAPAWPSQMEPPANSAAVAAAAWAQSFGSIEAFEQLCGEHLAGEIDLLAPRTESGT